MNIKSLTILIGIMLPIISIISIYAYLTNINISMATILRYISNFEFSDVHKQIISVSNRIQSIIKMLEGIGDLWSNVDGIIEGIKAIALTLKNIYLILINTFITIFSIAAIPFIAIADIIKGVFGFFGMLT